MVKNQTNVASTPSLHSRSVLPTPPTVLIGRQQEIATIRELLLRPEVRLLTLTGPPGVGKTRLSLRVADELTDRFAGGVVFIPLASLQDPTFVTSALMQACGLLDAGSSVNKARLQTLLPDKELLLLFDNFEQLLPAATVVADLLAGAPQLKVLITSRIPLHLYGEYEFAVPPLALPGSYQPATLQNLLQSPAIALFVARAQAVKPDFQLTPANAILVGQICRQLDGIPLAIELAAARSKLLPPQALLTRLSGDRGAQLNTLTSGARDLPVRQQTLRNAIAWSYDLLTPAEQTLLRWLGIFVGGWTLEAAEAICEGYQANVPAGIIPDLLDGLAALLDHSLLQRVDTAENEVRFTMLAMIREFALEQLVASGEYALVQRCHAVHFLHFAEQAAPALLGIEQETWLNRLEADHDNLRAALAWCVESSEVTLALEMGLALGQFWWRHGHVAEARTWLGRILDLRLPCAPYGSTEIPATTHAQQLEFAAVLYRAGAFAWHQGDFAQAQRFCKESLTLYQALGESGDTPRCLRILALIALEQGHYREAYPLLEVSLALCQQSQDDYGVSWSHAFLGRAATGLGHYSQATTLFGQALTFFRAAGEQDGVVFLLHYLGELALVRQDHALALTYLTEGLKLAQQLGHKGAAATILYTLGIVHVWQEKLAHAATCFQEAVQLNQTLGNKAENAGCYKQLARLAYTYDQVPAAIRLWCAAEELYPAAACTHSLIPQPELAPQISLLRHRLEPHLVSTVLTLPLGQIIEELVQHLDTLQTSEGEAQKVAPQTSTALSAWSAPLEELTAREADVLRLLVQGLTYVQIAEQLVISPRTVDAHLRAVYAKLGVRSRHEATRLAIEHHLV